MAEREVITEKDLDVWKAFIIGQIGRDVPAGNERSRRARRNSMLFYGLCLVNVELMLALGRIDWPWFLYALGLALACWGVTELVLTAYWRRRIRAEAVDAVLRFSVGDLAADDAPEIEFYERTYDIYITPARRTAAAARAEEYARRLTREKYERLKTEIRRTRILRLSKMMRAREAGVLRAAGSVFFCVAFSLLAGCLSAPPPTPANWTIVYVPQPGQAPSLRAAEAARLSSVEVRSPYNGTRFAVLRADGSVAFDPYNAFAASPASLLKGAAQDALEHSGLVDAVVGSGSFASAPAAVELQVTELALDCRTAGRRDASVALTLTVVKDRKVFATLRGAAKVPAEGDYTAAFSKAASQALRAACASFGSFGEKK